MRKPGASGLWPRPRAFKIAFAWTDTERSASWPHTTPRWTSASSSSTAGRTTSAPSRTSCSITWPTGSRSSYPITPRSRHWCSKVRTDGPCPTSSWRPSPQSSERFVPPEKRGRAGRSGGRRTFESTHGTPGRTVPQNRPRRDGGSRGVKRLRIAFVASSDSTFIQRDRELLRRFAAVRDVRWTGIRSIPRLAWSGMRSDAAFARFAPDHAYVACRLARLFRRKSFVVVGGVDVANVPELGYGAHIDPRTAARSRYALLHSDRILVVDASLP